MPHFSIWATLVKVGWNRDILSDGIKHFRLEDFDLYPKCQYRYALKEEIRLGFFEKVLSWNAKEKFRRFGMKLKVEDSVILDASAKIGAGTRIWHQTQIRDGVNIGIDCVIGRNVYIGSGVQVGNNCKIQNNALE